MIVRFCCRYDLNRGKYINDVRFVHHSSTICNYRYTNCKSENSMEKFNRIFYGLVHSTKA